MAGDEAYRTADKKIREARRRKATALNLDGMGLGELPESLGQLTQLQVLSLSNNRLTSLPEWLGQLTQLQVLSLSNNRLTSLPESLGQLTRLKALFLISNQLASLPESLGQLTQLQELRLDLNQLTSLPESLGQLTQLRALELNYNQLRSLPESLGQLTQLQYFGLNRNPLDPELAAAYEGTLEAVEEILRFFNVYHSMRYVHDDLVLRLSTAPSEELLEQINTRFTDLLAEGAFTVGGPLPEEKDEPELAELPRLIFPFNRRSYGRLRQLIDCLNRPC